MIKKNKNNPIKGLIVETEAYSQEEEACHGYHKKTQSNKPLFGVPGTFYVYKSYGIHYCLNIVTDRENFASGVLIRAVFIPKKNERLASGPGLVTKTFGIEYLIQLMFFITIPYDYSKELIIKEKDLFKLLGLHIKAKNIKWRWYLKNSRSVSKSEKGDRTPKF